MLGMVTPTFESSLEMFQAIMLLFCAVLLFFIAWYGKRHDTREEYVSRNFFCVVDDKLTRVVGALEAIEGKLGEMSDLLRSTAGQKNIVDEGQRAKIYR